MSSKMGITFLRTRKALAGVTLCAFVSGCSSYRSASLPRTDPVDVEEARVEETKIGHSARITLLSGEVITGEVSSVTSSSIKVFRVGNYGLEESTVAASDIAGIEVEHSSKTAEIVALSVTGVIVIGTIIGVLFANALANSLASYN